MPADICFTRAAPNPVALILLDWTVDSFGNPCAGTTVAKLDADGQLYGCRDIAALIA